MHPLVDLELPSGDVAIHWFEQSSYAVKDHRGTVVLVDPYFPRERPADQFIHPTSPLDESELPTDVVLLTHDHTDHTFPESLARILEASPDVVFVGPVESIQHVESELDVSSDQTLTVAAGDSHRVKGVQVNAVYAKPPEGDPGAGIDPPDTTHLGYVVGLGAVRLYFSGDVIHTFANLDHLVVPIATLRPDVGFLTNHPTEGEFPFFDGSRRMAQRIGLRHAVPAHYACFVARDYDPDEWAEGFPPDGPVPLIIPRNMSIMYPPEADLI